MIARERLWNAAWSTFANRAAKTRAKAEIVDKREAEEVVRGHLAGVVWEEHGEALPGING